MTNSGSKEFENFWQYVIIHTQNMHRNIHKQWRLLFYQSIEKLLLCIVILLSVAPSPTQATSITILNGEVWNNCVLQDIDFGEDLDNWDTLNNHAREPCWRRQIYGTHSNTGHLR